MELVQGKDYIVSYKNNINVGTANVVIEGQGNYTGKIEKRFQIAAVSENEITVDAGTNPVYSGNVVKPTITVRWGEKILTDGIDYDIRNTAGFNNISSGSASVDIVLKGNYSGTKIASYTIGMISSGGLTVDLENYSYNYSGNAYLPNVIVKNGNNILRKDSDYTVSYSNNIHAGTATVTVSFIGNYTGIITKNFEINKATINSLFLSSSSFNYSGNEIRPQVIVKDAAGATVGEDNYNVKYINNKNVGTATVIVEGTGDYNGSLTAKYIIVPVLENKNITMYLQQKHKIKVKSSDLVTYKSSRAKIAKDNKKGVVTAKKSGVTIIQIKTGGKNFNVKVKVENPRLSQKRANVFAGDKVVLKVNGGTGKVKWSSSNSKVATVKNGKVTAKKIGKAIINAKKNGKVLSCKIVVKKSAMNRKSVSTIAGEKIKLCVKGISGKPRCHPQILKWRQG